MPIVVRRIQSDDMAVLKSVRLAALLDSPSAFASSYEKEMAWSDDLWVTTGNEAAEGLYQSMGFEQTGDHQPLPSDPDKDETRMTRAV